MLKSAENRSDMEVTAKEEQSPSGHFKHTKSENYVSTVRAPNDKVANEEKLPTRQRAQSQDISVDFKQLPSLSEQTHDQKFCSDPKGLANQQSSSARKAQSSPGVHNNIQRCVSHGNQQFGQGDRIDCTDPVHCIHEDINMQSDDQCSCCTQEKIPKYDHEQNRSVRNSPKRFLPQRSEIARCKTPLANDCGATHSCKHIQDQQLQSRNDCSCEHSESDESNSSDDGKTYQSEYSRHTCFCSKNQSHEDLSVISDIDEVSIQPAKVERFRGGVDTINAQTTIINSQTSNLMCTGLSSYQRRIVNQVKFSKLGELCEDLERLKLRNRNLKDFLHTLDDPLTLIGKPSEATSACTEVSSCVTIDSDKQSHNSLLTVVKVLESKCRDKDALIGALADELSTNRRKSWNDGTRLKQNLNFLRRRTNTKNGVFTKKDTVIGLMVFIMITVSYLKKSDLVYCLYKTRRILMESPQQLVSFSRMFTHLTLDFLWVSHEKLISSILRTVELIMNRWSMLCHWLCPETCYVKVHQGIDYSIKYLLNREYLIPRISGIIIGLTLTALLKRLLRVKEINPNEDQSRLCKILNFYSIDRTVFIRLPKTIFQTIFSSRTFWFALGFSCHLLWSTLLVHNMDSLNPFLIRSRQDSQKISSEVSCLVPEVAEETIYELIKQLNYSWLIPLFTAKIQYLIQLSYFILRNLVS